MTSPKGSKPRAGRLSGRDLRRRELARQPGGCGTFDHLVLSYVVGFLATKTANGLSIGQVAVHQVSGDCIRAHTRRDAVSKTSISLIPAN